MLNKVHVGMEQFVVQGFQFFVSQFAQGAKRSARTIQGERTIQYHPMFGRMILRRIGMQIFKLERHELFRDLLEKAGGEMKRPSLRNQCTPES